MPSTCCAWGRHRTTLNLWRPFFALSLAIFSQVSLELFSRFPKLAKLLCLRSAPADGLFPVLFGSFVADSHPRSLLLGYLKLRGGVVEASLGLPQRFLQCIATGHRGRVLRAQPADVFTQRSRFLPDSSRFLPGPLQLVRQALGFFPCGLALVIQLLHQTVCFLSMLLVGLLQSSVCRLERRELAPQLRIFLVDGLLVRSHFARFIGKLPFCLVETHPQLVGTGLDSG